MVRYHASKDKQDTQAYGSPHAAFKAAGSVKDQSGKPIEGIRVAITEHIYNHNHAYYHDTLFTDSKGDFLLNKKLSQGP
ncbi:MAG: radical SAM-associated putative lipoprotein [Bacteroidales bacterium]|nr:radical SAM-associated putative lipoprotein [Bacteroidales bacterium]